jgi:UBX domain
MESKAQEEALAEAQAREKEREIEEKQEEEELAAAIKLSKQLDHEQEVESVRNRMLNFPEPAAGSNTEISMIRFTLPNGSRLQRRFNSSDTLETIRDFIFVATHELGKPICHFDFGTNFPRRNFPEGEGKNTTIKNAGLFPQAMLFITQTPAQRDLDKEELQKEVQ